MYFIYILYSEAYDKFYVGQSNDLERRLEEHNTENKNAFTTKYRPWKLLKSFPVGDSLGLARKIENHIKRQKSRQYIQDILTRNSIELLIKRFDGDA